MATSARYPVWLPAAPKPSAMAFAVLFAIESFARALVATVISVQAYDLLQSSQRVSMLFTAVGIMSLVGTLVIPLFISWTARRWSTRSAPSASFSPPSPSAPSRSRARRREC